jgi:hypothetical protein
MKFLPFLLLVLLCFSSCQNSSSNKPVTTEVLPESAPFTLKGLWYSNGNSKMGPHFTEFTATDYYRWPKDGLKPPRPSGSYVLDNLTMEVVDDEIATTSYFKINLINKNQIELDRLASNDPSIIYQRQPK